jgi:hypothetical protein
MFRILQLDSTRQEGDIGNALDVSRFSSAFCDRLSILPFEYQGSFVALS